jgi:hypothetical protein
MNKINRIVLVYSLAILAVLVIAGNAAAAVVENTRDIEWSYAACQRRVQSHAATVPPSTGSRSHASRSHKARTVSLASYNTTF